MHDQTKNNKAPFPAAQAGATWPQVERRRYPRTDDSLTSTLNEPQSPPALTPLCFSTQDLAPARQFEAWRNYMQPVIDVRLPENVRPQDGFRVTHTVWHLGKMLFVQQQSDAYSYARTAEQLRNSPIDHWYLGLRRSGEAWTEVNGHVIKTGSGRIAFRTLGHPYRGRCTQSEIILLYMPYNLFAEQAHLFKTVNNSILSGNLAKLLASYLAQLEQHLPTLTADDLPRIVQTIKNMIINGIEPRIKSENIPQGQLNAGVMERIHHYIHHNLYDQQLTPDKISRIAGISRTRLYQLFEPNGGVNNYIRRQRLQAAYDALTDPDNHKRILDIAQSVGFDVAANFTRAFINEFGISPSEVRKTGHITQTEKTDPPSASQTAASFEEWLKNLGN